MDIQIQYRFTVIDEETGYSYSDALYFPFSEWPVDEVTLNDLKQERFNNWKHTITSQVNPPPVEEQITAIDDQIESLQEQKESLLAQLEVS